MHKIMLDKKLWPWLIVISLGTLRAHIKDYQCHRFLVYIDAITNEREVLLWKFNDYDRNGDKVLNPSEEFTFLKDINTYFGCSKFHAHLQQLLNMDADDKKISLQEWLAFFGVNSPGKTLWRKTYNYILCLMN